MAEMKLPHEWSGEELWGYAMLHSQTEVAAFRHDMLALLAKSAGEDELAASLAAQPGQLAPPELERVRATVR